MPARQDADRAHISTLGGLADGVDYVIDAAQRGALFLDVMRQRGNQYREHLARIAPHVLEFEAELLVDGRTLDCPVNYVLARIVPPRGLEIDPKRRPFVVIDPRAGHGPGIGGFKADSEIGAAFKAGHPCYLVGFLPEPVVGQTIEDVARAEAVFLQKVIDLHPDADGKPCVVGNCQAGWAVMMLAAIRPELFGPIIVAGSPLSYWGGKRGQNPMRYSGGMLGGSWLTAMMSDLGLGKFDGTWLVQNFEKLNPSNTLWSKQYNLYSNIDTEAPRYLGFERWWGGHISLNAEEIQFIVDELFVGNNLAAGKIKTRDGTTIDLRNIRSPIVIFCSKADNITPPGQALGWILDLYEDVNEIRSYGQTIVYTVHESIGHLGIFVSAGVARKEHGELSSNIDLIDTLPPGLYEAVFESKEGNTASPDLVFGDWVMRCEERTLDDIRRLGANSVAEDRSFATAARISEINLSLYRTFMQPMVRAMATPQTAQWMRNAHPLRLQYELFSDANPLMKKAGPAVRWAKEHRRPVRKDNSLLRLQETISNGIVSWLDSWRDARDSWTEKTFFTVYGAPAVQAMAGIDPAAAGPMRKAPKSPLHDEMLQARIAELKSQIPVGGIREATVRALLFVGMPRGAIDERGFEMVRRIRSAKTDIPHLPLDEFKALVRAQFLMLLIDTDASIATIPAMLPAEAGSRLKALELLKQVIGARGEMPAESARRFEQIERLFKAGPNRPLISPANIEPRGDKRIAS
jgi:pimeloyl-ACP methyl ester carboxylesterase